MPNIRVVSRNFMEMIAALPASKLDELYDSPWTCQAVIRSLPPLSKQYVLRLLFVEAALSSKTMQDWALTDALTKHKVAIDRLEHLRVIIQSLERKKEVAYKLNPRLQRQLREVLRTGGGVPRQSMAASVAAKVPSLADLESYATNQWEAVLLQLVSSAFPGAPFTTINSSLLETFKCAGLLTVKGEESPRITDAGFQFLLMDTNSQLWQIVREYVASAEGRGLDSSELISFLLELGFLHVGDPYNLNNLSALQRNVIEELAALGLLQIQSGTKDRWFVPTKLAANLSASIAETSTVQTGKTPVIPETVTDQIRLWENDRNRVAMSPAYMYKDFNSAGTFESVLQFARDIGALLWEDASTKQMFVKTERHEEMRGFIRRQSNQTQKR